MRIEIVSPKTGEVKTFETDSSRHASSLAKSFLGREDDGTDVTLVKRSDRTLMHHDEEIGEPDPEGYEIAWRGFSV